LRSKSALLGVHKRLARDYPQLAGKFMHAPSGTGRITVSGAMLSAGALRQKLDTLRGIAAATLGGVARVTPAGYQPLYANIVGYVTRSQVDSLLLSFGLVFVLVWLFLRDARLAALTVIPNLFPVLVMLGAMGWLGIYLDTATASIAAIVLSICTDDSIHFIHAYRHHRRLGLSPAQARRETVAHVGPAVVLAGGVLFCGYAFMLLGSLKTVQLWGLLTAIAIAAAMFGELVLFPLVLERFDREPAGREVPGGS
jgi:predicted RND superfamily exporter protein